MQLVPTNYAVSDYAELLERGDIRVNRDYQRSGGQWPAQARSFFVETMLLGFPIPKISLYQVPDIRTRRTIREIVDGQQRTEAIVGFLNGEFRLTSNVETEELRGLRFDDIDPAYQQTFFTYPLPIDLYTGATPAEVREVFRRLNSYTSPLNAEEKRHAKFQGEFKWFANNLASETAGYFETIGVFSQRSLIRMADIKLITDLVHAFTRGIRTTKAAELDSIYREYDSDFPRADRFRLWIEEALISLAEIEDLRDSDLSKPHMFYALVLALVHLRHDVPTLRPIHEIERRRRVPRVALTRAIRAILAILEDEEATEPSQFLEAARAGTNVREARENRFSYICQQIEAELA